MRFKLTSFLIALCSLCFEAAAQTTTVEKIVLNDIDNGDPWPCLYYELNRNEDLDDAVAANWSGLDEDESYWQTGVGPFSCDANKFFITDWASEVHPILVRRHFTLTADDIANMGSTTATIRCSYDEDPVLYLNGHRLINYSGWNDNNYASYNLTKGRKDYFVEGDNVLAVSLRQGAGGGHIDYGLTFKVKVDTGIESVNANENSDSNANSDSNSNLNSNLNANVYTLNGMRVNVNSLPKGVYIINGEKTIIK